MSFLEMPSTLGFETQSLHWPAACRVSRVGWPMSPQQATCLHFPSAGEYKHMLPCLVFCFAFAHPFNVGPGD